MHSRITFGFFTILLSFVLFAVTASAVPVMPNEAVVTGTVNTLCLEKDHNGLDIRILKIHVVASDDIKDMPNFIRQEVGKEVVAYMKDDVDEGIVGKLIRAKIRYQGDERGGKYWITDIYFEGERQHE